MRVYGQRWPHDATSRYTIRATPAQVSRWLATPTAGTLRNLPQWIVHSCDFVAWWWSRERELQEELKAKLEQEAGEREGVKPWAP